MRSRVWVSDALVMVGEVVSRRVGVSRIRIVFWAGRVRRAAEMVERRWVSDASWSVNGVFVLLGLDGACVARDAVVVGKGL